MDNTQRINYEGVKWVWFDLDDTLCDFHAASDTALAAVYDRFNLKRFFATCDQWAEVYHRHNARLWDLYNSALIDKPTLKTERFVAPLVDGGADAETAGDLAMKLDPAYLSLMAANCVAFDGATDLLQSMRRRGLKIGILSNGFTEVQYDKIANCGLADLVDSVVLSDEIGINKPDRRLFDHALKKASTTADESLMIGDNPATDIAGAINAGWRAILVDRDAEPCADGDKPPCPVVNSLTALTPPPPTPSKL